MNKYELDISLNLPVDKMRAALFKINKSKKSVKRYMNRICHTRSFNKKFLIEEGESLVVRVFHHDWIPFEEIITMQNKDCNWTPLTGEITQERLYSDYDYDYTSDKEDDYSLIIGSVENDCNPFI